MALRLRVQLHQLSVLLLKAIMIELLLNETVSRKQGPRHGPSSQVCIDWRKSLHDGLSDAPFPAFTLVGGLLSHV